MIESRGGAAGFGIAMIAAVLAPVVQNFRTKPRDSFPLSHYPMFSTARPEIIDVTHLVGSTSSGESVTLRCSLLGLGGMNQLRKQIRRAATGARPERTTERLAGRVARKPEYADVVAVELVTCGYRVTEWFCGDLRPVTKIVHAASLVGRPAAP